MTTQEMIDFCKRAGWENPEAFVSNAGYLAENRGLRAPQTMQQLSALMAYKANENMQTVLTTTIPAFAGIAAYDASALLHNIYLLSVVGIHPAPQSDLL